MSSVMWAGVYLNKPTSILLLHHLIKLKQTGELTKNYISQLQDKHKPDKYTAIETELDRHSTIFIVGRKTFWQESQDVL